MSDSDSSSALPAEVPPPGVIRPPGDRWSARAALRARAFLAAVAEGVPELEAYERVLRDPSVGVRRYIDGKPVTKTYLRIRLLRELRRAAPHLVQDARAAVLAKLAENGDAAAEAVLAVARGQFPQDRDGAACARARKEGAELLLSALGVAGRQASSTRIGTAIVAEEGSTVNVVSLGDGLRQIRRRGGAPRAKRIDVEVADAPAAGGPGDGA